MNQDDNVLIYVIVLNYNGYDDSIACINSLIKTQNILIKIILVDNCSTDLSYEKFRRVELPITLIRTQSNTGFAGGMNYGIKYALSLGAEFILCTNNDTIYLDDTIYSLYTRLVKTNSLVCCPKVLYLDFKNIIYSAGADFNFLLCCNVSRFQGKVSSKYAISDDFTSAFEGSSFLMRKSVFEKYGFFDEKTFMYFEDFDYSMRLFKEKDPIAFSAQSVVYHRSGAGRGWAKHNSLYNYYYTRNRLYVNRNMGIPYLIYVILFSVSVVILKNIFVNITRLLHGKYKEIGKGSSELINGLLDGFKMMRQEK